MRREGTEVRDRITPDELAVKGARNRGELKKRKAIEQRRGGGVNRVFNDGRR